MNSKHILLLFGLLFSLPLFSIKLPGYYIDSNGFKKNVFFKVEYWFLGLRLDYFALQSSIEYTENETWHTLYPEDCRAFCFYYKNDSIRYISVFNAYNLNTEPTEENIFLRQEIKGMVSLYRFYTKKLTINGFSLEEGWILQHNSGLFMIINYGYGSKKEYMRMFFDHPDLVAAIDGGSLDGKRNMKDMIIIYNTWHKDTLTIK